MPQEEVTPETESVGELHSNTINTLWMGAVQPNWDENFLFNLFSYTNAVKHIKIIRNLQHRILSGYAFIDFHTNSDAERVLKDLNNKPIPGTNVVFRLNWGSGGLKKQPGAKEYSLFVGDLAEEVTDPILLETFSSRFRSTSNAKVITDIATGLSKRYGFVRFFDKDDCELALQTMNGAVIGSRPIRVDHATARKSEMGVPVASHGTSVNGTVFVGNLNESVTEDQLKAHFSCCGPIVSVRIPAGKGCGFVRYADTGSASTAIAELHGTNLAGSAVRLDWGKNSVTPQQPSVHRSPMLQVGLMGYPQYPFTPAWQAQHSMYYGQFSPVYSHVPGVPCYPPGSRYLSQVPMAWPMPLSPHQGLLRPAEHPSLSPRQQPRPAGTKMHPNNVAAEGQDPESQERKSDGNEEDGDGSSEEEAKDKVAEEAHREIKAAGSGDGAKGTFRRSINQEGPMRLNEMGSQYTQTYAIH